MFERSGKLSSAVACPPFSVRLGLTPPLSFYKPSWTRPIHTIMSLSIFFKTACRRTCGGGAEGEVPRGAEPLRPRGGVLLLRPALGTAHDRGLRREREGEKGRRDARLHGVEVGDHCRVCNRGKRNRDERSSQAVICATQCV
jgi:hypothetical protein